MSNHRRALAQAQAETQTLADGYSFFILADEHLFLGDLEAAVAAYDKAFTFEFPNHFDFLNWKGGFFSKCARDIESVPFFGHFVFCLFFVFQIGLEERKLCLLDPLLLCQNLFCMPWILVFEITKEVLQNV